ncbi:hypothetical protein K458DRAFT_188465 [Lentithecium fluviatile CBS 122367]|uniref:Uncharacterized protein n=1 Tax=Lentithecium fluviatile CBS 122367 TaxID=1168545 RepID=A0A6G1JAW0_9PLEO|nr:hypothetical protein K458DRAFT_188465 [Lentithecium fluviatile CBS 122367]
MSGSGLLRSATTPNASPSKSRVGSSSDLARVGSPVSSPGKRMPPAQAQRERKGSIWDSLFQVDVMYQKSRK